MNYFLKSKNNYVELLEKEIKKDLIKELEKITNINIVDNHIYFGIDYQGVIIHDDIHIEVKIINTLVTYKYYYGKTLDDLALFDRSGFENKDPKVLCNEILLLVKSLIGKELDYKELRKGQKILCSKLYVNDVLKFSFCLKNKKNNEKFNHNKIIRL